MSVSAGGSRPLPARPRVDVVVPFRGDCPELSALRARLARLRLRPGDSVLVVDNTAEHEPGPGPPAADGSPIPVLWAGERPTPGYARNRGAAQSSGEWLVFVDADTEPVADLLDRYFDPPPAPGTGLIAGGVIDEQVPPDAPGPARYAYLRGMLNQDQTMLLGPWSFVQTANAACRREAFEAVGGFREDIWPAEDADLTYRLRAGGWQIERREDAAVVHHSRRTARGLIRQAAGHGAGCAWLDRAYPGSFPKRRRIGLAWWGVRTLTRGLIAAARRRDRDTAVSAFYEPLWELSFEFGRSLSAKRGPGLPRRTGSDPPARRRRTPVLSRARER